MSGESPDSVLYDKDGNMLAVQSGVATPASTPALMIAGSDGTNSRYITIDGTGHPVVVGAGTAGTPSGGVITIQGVSGGTAIPVSGSTNIDAGNSSTTPLAGNGTFSGTGIDVSSYGVITVFAFADQAGTLNLEFSTNNSNWDDVVPYSVAASTAITVQTGPQSKYFRVVYQNGSSAQSTFRLQTIEKTITSFPDTIPVGTTVNSNNDAILTKSVITGKTTGGGGGYVDVKVNPSGTLTVDASGSTNVGITGTVTANQGTANTIGNSWPVEITDGTNILGTAAHPVRIDPTGTTTQPVSGTVSISGTVGVTQSTSPWVTNITQFGSNNVVTGTGASGVGIPRVTISNDSNILATQSGTWTVQPGNTANTTPWLVTANQGTPNSLANKWPVQITDGTNTMPTMDGYSRAGIIKLTDGTKAIGVLNQTLYSDPNGDRRTIHNNATLTTSGSTVLTWVGHSEWYLIVNIKNAPTGTTPTITFKIEQLDPIDQTTVITGERVFIGDLMNAAGTDVIEVPELVSDTLKISWTITGSSPSFTGVNVTFCGHGAGNAIEGQAQVGTLAGDAPVPIALVDADGYIQRIRGDSLGDIAIATNLANAFSPNPQTWIGDPQPLRSDPSGNLIVRGQVLTDEGSFRDDFGGSSLLTSLTGTYTFTNGSTTVTGSGTLFTTELGNETYIRLTAHANSALAPIEQIIDDTHLVLSNAYTGANGSGAASKSNWAISVAAGPANLTVGSSLVNLINSTVNGASVSIKRDGDYLPFAMVAVLSLSQRIANQQTVVGFEDVPQAATQFSEYLFDGTDNTKVKCRTAHDADSIQETLVTMPAGTTSAVANVFIIDQLIDRTNFYINGTQVATHQTHLPGPYSDLSQVAYITNTGAAGSQTTVSIDSVFFYDHDIIDLAEPVNVQGTVGGQPIVIQFGTPGGGTALPKIIDVYYNKSDGAIVANVFKRVSSYTVPAAYNGYLIKFTSFQGEAASSRVVSENNMGSHNDNTNVFTAGSSYTSPQWVSVVQAEVTTQFASGSGNVTLTVGYTNETGTAGRSGTISIPKGSVVGSRWDLTLQGTDLGVQSIQSVSGSPTQVGVSKILGLLQLALHQDQSTTTQTETIFAPGAITFPTGTVLGLEYSGGTVSKTRNLDMLVQLIQ